MGCDIGKGAQSVVRRAISGNRKVAVKVYDLSKIKDARQYSSIENEIAN